MNQNSLQFKHNIIVIRRDTKKHSKYHLYKWPTAIERYQADQKTESNHSVSPIGTKTYDK